jgi:hypothetical protein
VRVVPLSAVRPRTPIEPAFYDRLARGAARRSPRVAALVAAAQLANAAGFAAAALTDFRDTLPRP